MKVEIKVKKGFSKEGEKFVWVEVNCDGLTDQIFYELPFNKWHRLREVRDGEFMCEADLRCHHGSGSLRTWGKFRVESDEDIERLIQQIKNNYKEVWEHVKGWQGEKVYTFEFE